MRFPHLLLQPAPKLIWLLALIHLGAMLCIGFSAAPLWLKLLASLVNGYSAYSSIRRHGLLSHPAAIVELWTNAIGEWHLRAQNGKVYIAQLQGSTLLTRSLVILNFKCSGKRLAVSVIVVPDTLEAAAFRRLRTYLNIEQQIYETH